MMYLSPKNKQETSAKALFLSFCPPEADSPPKAQRALLESSTDEGSLWTFGERSEGSLFLFCLLRFFSRLRRDQNYNISMFCIGLSKGFFGEKIIL